jgi:PAS domain S-box-containing protein
LVYKRVVGHSWRRVRDWSLGAQYALAVGVMAFALALRLALQGPLGDRLPYVTVFFGLLPLAIIVSAGPFFAGAVVGCVGAVYLFIPPRYTFRIEGDSAVLEVGLFVAALATAALTAWLSERADRRRRAAEAMLRSFVDESPTCKWVTGPDGRILYANRAIAEALGRRVEEMVGRTHREILPPRLAALAMEQIEAVRRTKEPRSSFEEIEAPDGSGSQRVLEWRRFALKLEGDGHVLVAGMANDVTERARTQRALEQSEARLRAILEDIPIAVGVMDRQGHWTVCNARMRAFIPDTIPAYDPERAGRWHAFTVSGDPLPPQEWPGVRALRGETVLPGVEFTYQTDEGREIFTVVSAVPLRGRDGSVESAIAVVQDVTERKQLEQERARRADDLAAALAERTAEVRRAERALARGERMAAVGTMASGLAHDIKNVLLPLSQRMDDLLAGTDLKGEGRTDVTVMVALVDHLRQMARNLELFSRDPEQEGSEGKTDLAAWSRRIQPLFERSLSGGPGAERWVRLRFDIAEGLPGVAIAPHRLTQAVHNLVNNARDAILASRPVESLRAGPGCITVEARAAPGGRIVALRVIDDGCGMDAETLRRCTEPFFTTKSPAGGGGGGSGLGLSLARDICARIGGGLEVESQAGKGTTVTLTLPPVPAAAPVEPKAGPAPSGVSERPG